MENITKFFARKSDLSGVSTDSILEDIKNINKAGDTLLEIVNNILDITKIEEGKTKINNKPYSLADVIAEASNIINVSISTCIYMLFIIIINVVK